MPSRYGNRGWNGSIFALLEWYLTISMELFRKPESVFDPPPLLSVVLASPLKFLLRTVYGLINTLRANPKPNAWPITVVCISDIHSEQKNVPDGDLLIVSGDLTNNGTPRDIQAQIDWIDSLSHRHKVAIAGNHDYWLDPRARALLPVADLSPGSVDWRNIHYLQHSSIKLSFPSCGDRCLRIYGAPQIPRCGPPHFAFQYDRERDAWSETIPQDIDILVTHTPPKYHLDLPVALGCQFLLKEIWRVRPALHVFGHVHAGHGRETARWDEAQRAFEIGIARSDGVIWSTLDVTLWISLSKVVLYGCAGLLWERFWGGRGSASQLVNASLMYNNTGQLANEPQVVEI